ncbi:MAG TPA: hypothetical protein VGB63_07595 [Pedobacter sp.]|jgi:hypothetical protein
MKRIFTTVLVSIITTLAYSQYLPLTGGNLSGQVRVDLSGQGNSYVGTGGNSNIHINHDASSTVNLINTAGGGFSLNGALKATSASFRIDNSTVTRNLALSNNNTTNNTGTSIYMGYAADSGDPYGIRLIQNGNPTGTRSGSFAIQRHGANPGDSDWLNSLYIDYSGNTTLNGALTGTSATFKNTIESSNGLGNYIRLGGVGASTSYLRAFETHFNIGNVYSGGSFGIIAGNAERLKITSDGTSTFSGNTHIGTTQTNANLYVQGIIKSKEVKVEATVAVPDYVFEKSYDLKSLKDVEQYITQNKHLPEIPSAKEIGKDGINVGDMQMKLLQKIEELTLYLIEQNKRIQELEKQK